MDKFQLLQSFFEQAVGEPLEGLAPRRLSGTEVMDALWPLNEIFRPRLGKFRALKYDARFEPEADTAIEKFIAAPVASTWDDISDGAWRVLFERQSQALIAATANEAAGNPVMPVPEVLPPSAHLGAAMIFLLYQMKLPWPPDDRSQSALPYGSPLAPARKH